MKQNSGHWLFCETLISLWELKLHLYQPVSWQKCWHWEVESQVTSHSDATVLLGCPALLNSGDQSSALLKDLKHNRPFSYQGLLRAAGNKWQLMDGGETDLRIRWRGAIISILNLVLCSSFPAVLGHQVNHSEQTSQIFCPHHLEKSLGFC